MTDPDRKDDTSAERNDVALWILMGIMALIVVGGLTFGLSHPGIYNHPPQTVGSAAAHMRSGHPM